jgi:hypothetical protein
VPANARIRVLRHRCRVLLATGGVGLGLVIAMAPSALGQPASTGGAVSRVPVTPCPFIPEPGFAKPPAPPPSVVLPPSVTLPPGAAVYAADEDYGNPSARMTFSIGPAGLHCTVAEGADGTFIVTLAASGRSGPSVEYDFNSGGVGNAPMLACPYFAALVSRASSDGGEDCARPVGAVVTQIATGQPQLWAATILDPPGVPLLAAARPSSQEALNVMVASTDLAQFASCALPSDQRQVCVAGLDYFVTQTIAAQAGPATAAAIRAAIGPMARTPRSSTAAPECRADVDVSLEATILKSPPISIPGDAVDLPGLVGRDTVSLVPAEVGICDARLTPVLNTPGGFHDGELSLSARIAGRASRGPFVYSADSARWTSTPGAPAGQQLVTSFKRASVTFDLDPSFSLSFDPTSGEITPAIDIAQVKISVPERDVTLVGPRGPFLQVGLGPTLEITAQISKQDVAEEVEDGESEGLPSGAIDVAVAEDDGADVAIGVNETLEPYGVTISPQVSEALAQEAEGDLFTAIDSDPVLASFAPGDPADLPADAQPVDTDITAADGTAFETDTLAGGDIIADGLPDLILLLFA